eukprot:CAMPEP_0206247730 /NCGR_PEP_ID=MMETSP0047_2-20121206/19977_1 /ASSEMBLY_ACC=CAM_ASM_000192 /TAXON_ID=195065 /ORGANISM="Chroomonas mesostigmatica_cf, Strain CCMP1168" /LENGTH=167 /DNA_ID=CAMNT_0053673297 /DNA_START=11 /DNA_END=514 /DNA_ORIENTATION=+
MKAVACALWPLEKKHTPESAEQQGLPGPHLLLKACRCCPWTSSTATAVALRSCPPNPPILQADPVKIACRAFQRAAMRTPGQTTPQLLPRMPSSCPPNAQPWTPEACAPSRTQGPSKLPTARASRHLASYCTGRFSLVLYRMRWPQDLHLMASSLPKSAVEPQLPHM